MPRRCSCWVSVAVDTLPSCALQLVGEDDRTRDGARSSGSRVKGLPCGARECQVHCHRGGSSQPRAGPGGTRVGSILGNRVQRVEDPRMLTVGRHLRRGPPARRTRRGSRTSARPRPTPASPSIDVDEAKAAARRARRLHRRRSRRARARAERQPELPRGDAPAVRRRRDRALRRPARRRGRSPRTAPGGRRRRARRRRLRPAAGRRRSGGERAATRCCCSPTPARTSCSAGRAEAAGRLQRVRGRRGGADRQPAHDGGADRAPLGRRLLDRRRSPRALLGVPGRAPDPRSARRRSTGSIPRRCGSIVPDVGGGFGAKSRTYPEELALGFYARQVGRPVRWTETRSENMVAMPHGRGQVQRRAASAAPATAASPPTSSTWCRTPAPTR